MIETIKNLTAEQWIINVALPVFVGLILLAAAAVIPKLPFLVKRAGSWVIDILMMGWFTLGWRLRNLFTTKEEKARQAQLIQKVRDSMLSQSIDNNNKMRELLNNINNIKYNLRVPRL